MPRSFRYCSSLSSPLSQSLIGAMIIEHSLATNRKLQHPILVVRQTRFSVILERRLFCGNLSGLVRFVPCLLKSTAFRGEEQFRCQECRGFFKCLLFTDLACTLLPSPCSLRRRRKQIVSSSCFGGQSADFRARSRCSFSCFAQLLNHARGF